MSPPDKDSVQLLSIYLLDNYVWGRGLHCVALPALATAGVVQGHVVHRVEAVRHLAISCCSNRYGVSALQGLAESVFYTLA